MNRLFLLTLLTYGLFLATLATRQGELLVLAIPLVIYLGAGLISQTPRFQLEIDRELSSHYLSPGEPVLVRLTVTNKGGPLEELRLEDLLPQGVTLVAGQTGMLVSLASEATAVLTYTLSGQRGAYQFPGLRVTATDRFGLIKRQALLSTPGQFLVLPEIVPLKRVEIRPRQTRVYSGQIPARQGGPGVEFFGVREYQPGDPLRWINGRASARHPRSLYINEFEQERVADVGLILDAREQSDVRAPDGTLFEYSIQATASLAHTFLNSGNRVGLFIYGRSLDWTFPGYGKRQRERIMRALARARQGGGHVFEKLEHLPTRLFPARSQLALVSPLLKEDGDLLIKLRARGYRLLVISPDPIAFERRALADSPHVEVATRLARLERELLLARLRQADIRVVDWPVEIPFPQAAHTALSRLRQV